MSFDLKITDNDLRLNPDGSLQTVHDNEKLIQDILKIVLTSAGSNKIFRWYGSALGASIIGNVLDSTQLETEVARSVQTALSNLVALQKSQGRTQYMSAGETIAAIRGVSVIRSETDPRIYEVGISVLTRKLTIVEDTFTLRVA
jgi:phage baseplate assembly protein W